MQITIENLTTGKLETYYQGDKVKMHNAWYYQCLKDGLVITHAPIQIKHATAIITSGNRYRLIG